MLMDAEMWPRLLQWERLSGETNFLPASSAPGLSGYRKMTRVTMSPKPPYPEWCVQLNKQTIKQTKENKANNNNRCMWNLWCFQKSTPVYQGLGKEAREARETAKWTNYKRNGKQIFNRGRNVDQLLSSSHWVNSKQGGSCPREFIPWGASTIIWRLLCPLLPPPTFSHQKVNVRFI